MHVRTGNEEKEARMEMEREEERSTEVEEETHGGMLHLRAGLAVGEPNPRMEVKVSLNRKCLIMEASDRAVQNSGNGLTYPIW